MKRDTWVSRSTFILAAIGSAVGLGNAWRFPGLAAKHGGGAFLVVYLVAMLALGIPLLMAEIAIGRHTKKAASGAMRVINKKSEFIGWMSVGNGFFIEIYYAAVFAWVILMFALSWKFAGLTGNTEAASSLWAETIKTTGTTSGYTTISVPVLICLILAWGAAYWCIRNGTTSVGKVVKYTVTLPIICLLVLAIKGFTMPGAAAGLAKLFIPDWSALSDSTLWVDAIGQVFYSLSVAMAIMVAYGSFLKKDSNIAADAMIIAFSDMLVSVLAGIVMFTTMAGVGMLDSMSASGIATAFIIYPQAIVSLTNIPWINAAFAFVFYFCLITLAIDSLFSIVEGVSAAISDKFGFDKKKVTRAICIFDFVVSLVFVTGAGLAVLDIVDNFINSYSLVLTGVLESIVLGWFFKTNKILDQINRNTKKFRMPKGWLNISLKFICPVILSGLFIWNIVSLIQSGGIYGAADGYSLKANIAYGWVIIGLICCFGGIIKVVEIIRVKKGASPEADLTWDDCDKLEAEESEEA